MESFNVEISADVAAVWSAVASVAAGSGDVLSVVRVSVGCGWHPIDGDVPADRVLLESTDRYRLLSVSVPAAMVSRSGSVVVDRKASPRLLKRDGLRIVADTDSGSVVMLATGSNVAVTTELATSPFPKVDSLWPGADRIGKLEPGAFNGALLGGAMSALSKLDDATPWQAVVMNERGPARFDWVSSSLDVRASLLIMPVRIPDGVLSHLGHVSAVAS